MESFILPPNGAATPDSVARKRKLAEAMLQSGLDYSPIASPWQGAARMANALVGGFGSRRADTQEAEGRKSAKDAMTKALMGKDKAAMLEAFSNPFMDNASMNLLGDAWKTANAPPPEPNLMTVGKQIYNVDTGEWIQPPAMPEGAGDPTEYGLQPIVTQEGPNDPNPGKYHLFQPAKDGSAPREIPLPHNWTPRQQFLDTGTAFQPMPVQGSPVPQASPIPKNVAGEAKEKKIGADEGEAAALHSSLASKMPGLEQVVSQLEVLADKATYTRAGQLRDYGMKELGMDPTESAIARAEYIAMVDNQVLPMLRDTFGAQFTVTEGETLRKTLGDPNKAPAEKKAVLRAFIEQKKRNLEAAAMQGGVSSQQQPAPGAVPDFSTMSDQELEAIINGP